MHHSRRNWPPRARRPPWRAAYLRGEYEAFVAIPDAPVTISTHADRASQELILVFLHERFPTDALCAEESTPAFDVVPKSGHRAWVVDPIDGTRGFAKKVGQFSVMIGLLVDGKPVVGVVAEPAQDRSTFAAARRRVLDAIGRCRTDPLAAFPRAGSRNWCLFRVGQKRACRPNRCRHSHRPA